MKRSSHKPVYAGKSFQPGHNILISYSFLRDSRNPIAVIYMPLSPMSKTSKLNITDQPVFSKMLSKGFDCLLMLFYKNLIVVIR